MDDQFQAYAHVNNGEYQYWNPVGVPQASEALAWREVHNVGIQFFPGFLGAPRAVVVLAQAMHQQPCPAGDLTGEGVFLAPVVRVPIR